MKRLSAAVFLGTLIQTIAERTGVPCHDCPDNDPSPFYAVDLVQTEPANTKTMYVDRYDVDIHCIAAPTEAYSNAPVLRMVAALEEAMELPVTLQEPFYVFRQDHNGIRALKRDESEEGHAIVSYEFHICYGYRIK